jgi:hypothetical protein
MFLLILVGLLHVFVDFGGSFVSTNLLTNTNKYKPLDKHKPPDKYKQIQTS